ncbi:AsmA family protein [Sphingopyxis sp. NFH-91]|uniref:AsmA family protein n=1 Tax=Sphingopyxis sp. NFH-91 TaxID=2744457 RepID=UPI001F21A139|nr:AsmA family protein [Sphingopyxis sp. NFH-91]
MNRPALPHLSRKARVALVVAAGVVLLAALLLATFPVGMLRGTAEARLSEKFGAPVHIGALERKDVFSFSPEIEARSVRIGQPAWAGRGDMATIGRLRIRLPILKLLTGTIAPRSIDIDGLSLALVRDAEGRSNWGGPRPGGSDSSPPPAIGTVRINEGRFTLKDAKRRLDIAGTIEAKDAKGLAIAAEGQFNGAAAKLGAAARWTPDADGRWPFSAELTSDLLRLRASGTMAAPLDTAHMTMRMAARGTSLKQLDYIIEAGLFGTQAIDLDGAVRRDGTDWFIDKLDGRIGRSTIAATAKILKRDGRTRIDASIDAPRLDFDDLADDAGLAAARAQEARIGPRIFPDTRINLAKMGPTDGVIRITIHQLLVKGGSVFKSLKGQLSLDHRILTLDKAVAQLGRGTMSGRVRVDSRGKVPLLTTELRIDGASFDDFIGQPDMIRGPVRGLVRISGRGDTVRQAFASGNGKIAFVASGGAMNRAAAYVMAQDLGGAIGQKLGDDEAMTPIRCAILAFSAKDGLLTPAPLVIDTTIARARGRGQINLDGERIALAMNGAGSEKPDLKLVDPVKVEGTLSQPTIGFAPPGKKSGGGVFGAVTRSIGAALGLHKDPQRDATLPKPGTVNCRALAAEALR